MNALGLMRRHWETTNLTTAWKIWCGGLKWQNTIRCANYHIRYRPLRRIVKPYVIYKTETRKIGIIDDYQLDGLTSGEVLQKCIKDPIETANRLAKN